MTEKTETNNDWKKTEYEQVSEDFRHNTVMGWQSFLGMIATDGVLLALIPNVQNNIVASVVFFIASFSTFIIASTEWKWTNRNHNLNKDFLEDYASKYDLTRFREGKEGRFLRSKIGYVMVVILLVIGGGLFVGAIMVLHSPSTLIPTCISYYSNIDGTEFTKLCK